jgi:hypothetical protein
MDTRKKFYWIGIFLSLVLAISVFFYVRSEGFQEKRPDIELMLDWIDTVTRYEDTDHKAKFAVWYLSKTEHNLLQAQLEHLINANCYVGATSFIYGPGYYATQILASKGDENAITYFLDVLLDPEREGSDLCLKFALEGMKKIGEDVEPVMLERAQLISLEKKYLASDKRPDIEWMLSWIDTKTYDEETDYHVEFGVWYLSIVDYEPLFAELEDLLLSNCWIGMDNWHVFGPSHYATRILALKGDEVVVSFFLDHLVDPWDDGPDPCELFVMGGLKLIGERMVPIMLARAQDTTLGKFDRSRTLLWLGDMGQDELGYDIVCRTRFGCKTLGSEVGLQWSDMLLNLLENDTEYIVRSEAARALLQIGDPRAIEAVKAALEKEENESYKSFYEALLEDYVTE